MRMKLAEIREFISILGIAEDEHTYIGKLDNKQPCSIGIYHRKQDGMEQVAIGGRKNGTYGIKRISLLVHWNKNPVETEEIAYKLYDVLKEKREFYISTTYIHYVRMMLDEPKDVGTDEAGIYEFVIWVDFIYSESEEKE